MILMRPRQGDVTEIPPLAASNWAGTRMGNRFVNEGHHSDAVLRNARATDETVPHTGSLDNKYICVVSSGSQPDLLKRDQKFLLPSERKSRVSRCNISVLDKSGDKTV